MYLAGMPGYHCNERDNCYLCPFANHVLNSSEILKGR